MSQIIKSIRSNIIRNSVCSKHQINVLRTLCSVTKDSDGDKKVGGFAKAFEKYTAPPAAEYKAPDNETFASLLRNSKFVDVRILFF